MKKNLAGRPEGWDKKGRHGECRPERPAGEKINCEKKVTSYPGWGREGKIATIRKK